MFFVSFLCCPSFAPFGRLPPQMRLWFGQMPFPPPTGPGGPSQHGNAGGFTSFWDLRLHQWILPRHWALLMVLASAGMAAMGTPLGTNVGEFSVTLFSTSFPLMGVSGGGSTWGYG